MAPRKPKQPARKAAPRKAAKKTTPDFNPETHLLGGDGKVYERKVVSGTGVAAGVNTTQKTADHLALEHKMSQAILQAHSEGVSDPQEIQRRMMKARDEHLGNA
jgi:hypothetical protein